MKRIIRIPFIPELEKSKYTEFESALVANCELNTIDCVNWPDNFPLAPNSSFRIARSLTHLAIEFYVSGPDLRATFLEDNGHSWEDSCVEFFISPDGKEYFNIEINCIGSILMGRGSGREGRAVLPAADVARIIRRSSLERREYNIEGGSHEWSVAVMIPFDLLGLDGNALPPSVGANFYKCGNLTAHKHFVSWSPISIEKPDFHRPDFFGTLEF